MGFSSPERGRVIVGKPRATRDVPAAPTAQTRGGARQLRVRCLLYSAFTSSRGTQTQAIVADAATDADRDAAFSMYFLLGFISQPFWVLVTGYLMDKTGFATALTLLSVTYIVGIFILSFLKDERSAAMKPAA